MRATILAGLVLLCLVPSSPAHPIEREAPIAAVSDLGMQADAFAACAEAIAAEAAAHPQDGFSLACSTHCVASVTSTLGEPDETSSPGCTTTLTRPAPSPISIGWPPVPQAPEPRPFWDPFEAWSPFG